MMSPAMTAEAVLAIIGLLLDHNFEVILDGGWVLNFLVGKQTRSRETTISLSIIKMYLRSGAYWKSEVLLKYPVRIVGKAFLFMEIRRGI